MTTFDATSPAGPGSAAPGAGATPLDHTRRKRRRKLVLLAVLAVVVLVFALMFRWYLSTRKPLSQLPGLNLTKLPHYEFSLYGVTHPLGVAVTPSGERIYVTESDGARLVRVYNRAGKQVGTLQPPKSTGPSHVPVYVAVDPTTRDVYVSDRPRQAVYVYDSKGVYRHAFAPRGNLGGGWQPLGLAFDRHGDLYVTDVSGPSHRVLEFRPDGTLVRSLGAPGQLSFPNGVAVDSGGTVYVSDSNNGRLVIFDPAGRFVATINRGVGQGDLGLPRGAAIDDRNHLYVVDTSAHVVKAYRTGSAKPLVPNYIGSFGEEGQLEGAFEYPNGVAVDSRGRIYVTDRENNRVQVWGY